MIRAAIYLRKSRGKEEDLFKHEQELTSLCIKRGWNFDIYKEIGSSQDNKRTEYVNLKKNISLYKKIVVMALDRLSREKVEQAELTILINEYDFEIVTPLRSYTKEDSLMMDIQELIARQEYKLIKDRQIQGQLIGHRNGNWVAGTPPIGYFYDKNIKKLIVNKEKALVYLYMKDLALNGENCSKIAQMLNALGYRTNKNKLFTNVQVANTLRRKTYIGMVSYKKNWVLGSHEKLISEEEFYKIQDILDKRKVKKRSRKNIYPLTDLIRCKYCSSLYSVTRRKERGFKEHLVKCWYKSSDSQTKCKNKGIKAEIIHKEIRRCLLDRLKDIEYIIDNIKLKEESSYKKEINLKLLEVDERIKRLYKKKKNILIMGEEGIYTLDEVKEKILKIEGEVSLMTSSKKELNRELKKSLNSDTKNYKNEIINFLKYVDYSNPKYDFIINTIYKKLIDIIFLEVTDNEVIIEINFK